MKTIKNKCNHVAKYKEINNILIWFDCSGSHQHPGVPYNFCKIQNCKPGEFVSASDKNRKQNSDYCMKRYMEKLKVILFIVNRLNLFFALHFDCD